MGVRSADIDRPHPLFVQNRDPDHKGYLAKQSRVEEYRHGMTGFSRKANPASQEKPAPPYSGEALGRVHVGRRPRSARGFEVLSQSAEFNLIS
jgi:hypothetical protein